MRLTLFVGWGEGLGLTVGIEKINALEMQKCLKTFDHDCSYNYTE